MQPVTGGVQARLQAWRIGRMEITVNGQRREVSGPLTMRQLLEELRVPAHTGVAVLLNGDVIRRARWDETAVQPHDALEIVHATAGG